MRISDWSSDVCSSDLVGDRLQARPFRLQDDPRFRADRAERGAVAAAAGGDCRRYSRGGAGRVERLETAIAHRAGRRRRRGAAARSQAEGARIADRDARKPSTEEHKSELQSLMRNSDAVFCLKKKKKTNTTIRKSNTGQDTG